MWSLGFRAQWLGVGGGGGGCTHVLCIRSVLVLHTGF